jgi:hypothetical protein
MVFESGVQFKRLNLSRFRYGKEDLRHISVGDGTIEAINKEIFPRTFPALSDPLHLTPLYDQVDCAVKT